MLLTYPAVSSPTRVSVYGATMAAARMRPLPEMVAGLPADNRGIEVLLDFVNVQSATSSYLQQSVLWLIDAAQRATDNEGAGHRTEGVLALDVWPFVTNLNDEVRGELRRLLRQEERVCMEAVSVTQEGVTGIRVLGVLDPHLRAALEALVEAKRATAAELHARYPTGTQQRPITKNAWSNKLIDLFRLRLVRRTKHDRQWIYEPVVAEVAFDG